MQQQKNRDVPLFTKWRHWYWLVIGFLVLLIILFTMFTKHYA